VVANRAETQAAPRILFVGGLHRSGTSLVHRCITRHPDITGFSGTGVPEDEGQHLQTVYPRAFEFGGAGRFGFDPRMHLTESSPLIVPENRDRLLAEWGRYWDAGATVRVEKSPPNLVRMRFLQALFPDSAFLVVVRHPVAVACATQKWAVTRHLRNGMARATWTALIHHWVACHRTMLADGPSVQRLFLVRYEDFVRDPDAVLARVYARLGVPPAPAGEEVRSHVNDRYLALWHRTRNPLRVLDRAIATARFDGFVQQFGYSLRDIDALGGGPVDTMMA
jgi:hypothetical protein